MYTYKSVGMLRATFVEYCTPLIVYRAFILWPQITVRKIYPYKLYMQYEVLTTLFSRCCGINPHAYERE